LIHLQGHVLQEFDCKKRYDDVIAEIRKRSINQFDNI